MQVTASISVDFPKLGWGINAGDVRDLPDDADAQKQILAHSAILEVKTEKSRQPKVEE